MHPAEDIVGKTLFQFSECFAGKQCFTTVVNLPVVPCSFYILNLRKTDFLLCHPGFEKKKFRFSDHPDELFAIEQKILDLYNQIPSVEIWNLENMNIFFRQIEFYRDGQVFESDEDVYILYEAIEKLWDHLEEQASLGYKFNYNDPQKKKIGEFKMYFNEVLLGDNNMMVELDGTKLSYISHTTINFMFTRDVAFNENMYNHIQNQVKRSTLISEVSEKERARFFRIVRDRILSRKQNLGL